MSAPREGVHSPLVLVVSGSVLVLWRFAEYGIGVPVDKHRKIPMFGVPSIPQDPFPFPSELKALLGHLGQF